MSFDTEEIHTYIKEAKHFILITVNTEKGQAYPEARTMGAFVNTGLTIYFSTGKHTSKVRQIEDNPRVSAFFQHEGQDPATFKNVTVIGRATPVSDKEVFNEAVALIADKSPTLRERLKTGELDSVVIYQVEPEIVKTYDAERGHGPQVVEVIDLVVPAGAR